MQEPLHLAQRWLDREESQCRKARIDRLVWLAFAALSTDSQSIVEGFMPIRIKSQDKSCHGAQVSEAEQIIDSRSDKSAAC